MPILETERLLFRLHQREDWEARYEMESDPLFRHPFTPLTREESERSLRFTLAEQSSFSPLATVYKPEGQYIGRCGLYPERNEDGEILPGVGALAFYLARPYWGRGLAIEAGRAFVEYGFRELGLTRIVAAAAVANIASQRAILNSGLVYTDSGGEGPDGGPAWHAYEIRNPHSI